MKLKSLKETQNFSKQIAAKIKAGDTIFLYGEIGVGKTTFVRFFINHLENVNKIKNSDILSPTFNIVYDYSVGNLKIPTFNIVYDYSVGNLKILHYDLYRLKNYKDIAQLGIFDTSEDHIKIVEWPELIKVKPKNRIDIRFQYLKSINSRKVEVIGFGKFKEYEFFKI